jgi:reverse transcriptase-like protein
MGLDKNELLEGLIRYNYFPAQKKRREEMPPVFSTTSLSVTTAQRLKESKRRVNKNYQGYDQVEYKATKFNNVPRYFGIPHPKAYADLCFDIAACWKLLAKALESENSQIAASKHADGRVIVMDYEQSYSRAIRHLDTSFDKQFLVKTDVSNCFPSVYSHALPWALVGTNRAKNKKGNKWKHKWFNRLDESTRWLKRNETQGLAVGPATSNILSEAILAKVDQKMRKQFVFDRYIDDYSCYAQSYEDAEEFVRKLSVELQVYNFQLSPSKTEILPLPVSLNDAWTNQLIVALPKGEDPSLTTLVGYLDAAVEIQSLKSEYSVIKYAAKAIIGKATGKRRLGVAKYLLGLSLHYPVLIPVYEQLLAAVNTDYSQSYEKELLALLEDRILNQCSDGVCWVLHYLEQRGHAVDAAIAEKVIATKDCCSIVMLGRDIAHRSKLVKFAKSLPKSDLYGMDRYWLLLYQLYISDDISNPYGGDNSFQILKDGGANFVEGW